MPGAVHTLEVRPAIPPAISRLEELANNLLYSWDRNVRRLFFNLDEALWEACGHSPKLVLRRLSQSRLDEAACNPDFLDRYRDALTRFDAYMKAAPAAGDALEAPHVAYFCMEFGIHESVGLYSGGLGILAGDYCKAASYGVLPFTAVGLMYRQGYFTQTIDSHGAQRAHPHPADPDELPVQAVLDGEGQPLQVDVPFPGRLVRARVWRADVGRVALFLLDTDVEPNSATDRAITFQLYGGDSGNRIAQELVLGVGGVKALRAMGLAPDVWHVNEGHPALLILELCREAVVGGLPFDAALEKVAASVVFTTHTPVSAGHDRFDLDMAGRHLAPLAEQIGVPVERLLALGASPHEHGRFNMTTLSLRGSRHCNGVSRIHRDVAARMSAHVWPQIEPDENPMQYVTNGVHVPTFLAREWSILFDSLHAGWRARFCDSHAFWRDLVHSIPDHRFWSLRQSLKSAMLGYVADCLQRQYERMNLSRARIENMRRALCGSSSRGLCGSDTRALVLGFARRITAYKRPLLLFRHRERLERLLQDSNRPILLLFAGKAHPQDGEGQAMIRAINELASQPPFLGKLFFIEDYNIALARKLLTGVDVWLNTPDYPQEASGTSGQKAAVNGVVNLSVLDGWWAEGYDGDNGWAIAPHDRDLPASLRDDLEAEELLSLLEDEVLDEYFQREGSGLPQAWLQRAKASMASILPEFNADRMLADYTRRIYRPAVRCAAALSLDKGAPAGELANWKRRVEAAWAGVALRWLQAPPPKSRSGEALLLQVAARTGGLGTQDFRLECVIESNGTHALQTYRFAFEPRGQQGDEMLFELSLTPPAEGLLTLRVRAYPCHELLSHPFELGLMTWLEQASG